MEPWQRARDARPVVGAGPGFGRDRPQSGDERRAGIGSQGRAPRRDVRHRQAGEGRGRRARPRGTRVRGGGARTGRTWPASPACAWPTARSAARRPPPTCPPAGSPAGRAPPPWTPGGRCRGRRNRRYHGAASHGGMDGLARRSGHGARRIGLVYATGVGECGMPPTAGMAGDPYGSAMAEGADGAYRTGLVRRRKPFRDPRDLESATFRRVSWRGLEASAPALGPPDTGTDRTEYYVNQAAQAAPLLRTEKSGHIKAQAVNS